MVINVIDTIKNAIFNKFLRRPIDNGFIRVDKNSDQNTIRMIQEVLGKMRSSSDEDVKKIAENISYLDTTNYHIVFKGNTKFGENYVRTSNQPYREKGDAELNLYIHASRNIVAHEFGHLVQDLVDDTLPDDYEVVKEVSMNHLKKNMVAYKQLLDKYIDYYSSICRRIFEKYEKYKRENPELIKKMVDEVFYDQKKRNEFIQKYTSFLSDEVRSGFIDSPEKIYDFIHRNILMDQYNEEILKARFSGEYLSQISIITDIIKSINNGKTIPGLEEEKYKTFDSDIYNHCFKYYQNIVGVDFREQFANYMILKVYPEKYSEAIHLLRSIIGDEWFKMMDEKYRVIADKMSLEEGITRH